MAADMTMEIYPPLAGFTGYLVSLIVGIHSNIPFVGSTTASKLFKGLADLMIMADFFTDIRIQTMIRVPGGKFLKPGMRLTPSTAVTPGFFDYFLVFFPIHHVHCAAAMEVSSIVILIKNVTHKTPPLASASSRFMLALEATFIFLNV